VTPVREPGPSFRDLATSLECALLHWLSSVPFTVGPRMSWAALWAARRLSKLERRL
jgi:hypothetical protein